MQPLNPFLAAFFKQGSSVAALCTHVHQHILLVPTTEFFLTSRETESGLSVADFVATDDFLASHVLRIPSLSSIAGGKDGHINLRDWRGKAKEYNTLNGRTIIIKDGTAWSHKGFRGHNQTQLLTDSLWHADTMEPKQWLVYYISRPLMGSWDEIEIPQAVFVEGLSTKASIAKQVRASTVETAEGSLPKKKDIKNFQDVLDKFPTIAKQMKFGLEKLFKEFNAIFDKPLPPPPSAAHIPDPAPDGPIATARKKALASNGAPKRRSSVDAEDDLQPVETFAEDEEDIMRVSLETAVMNAIDLFQEVDAQQLSILGATTELTGPLVERLLERYVAGHVNKVTWPRLALLHRPSDQELEAKIRQMEFIDISQLGIFIEGSLKKKRELVTRLGIAVDEFRKMTNATCALDMMDILLSTVKAATQLAEQPDFNSDNSKSSSEKMVLTVNADTLVSLLLFVVIRAGVKNLQARLLYMKTFIFTEDVDSGEMGYALSTFEAVLSYLSVDSRSLRRASRRNKALWDAIAQGNMVELRRIIETDSNLADDDECNSPSPVSSHAPSLTNGSSRRSSLALTPLESFSQGSGLGHVFPFQNNSSTNDFPTLTVKKMKRVAMDTRSLSSSSVVSYHSVASSAISAGSGLEGDTSVKRLCQTQDSFGESILMMAVQNKQPESLAYLLSLEDHFPREMILEDTNDENTSLLSAAVQLGHDELIDIILDYIMASTPEPDMRRYFALQDVRGRSVAHYLFHAPAYIVRIGKLLPWRQKDKNGQTPLFALCRSYDHPDYCNMVQRGIEAALLAQGDGQPLHLDDHVDCKGNTLLHIANDPQLTVKILLYCDVDVNATNERKFTALMVASKYSRFETIRALYSDPRVDVALRESRGLTAVELAKDDEVRNRIDDMALFTMVPGLDDRITGVVRSFFVEDATIRLVLKSGAPANENCYTVTTCRRSLTDFERLVELLSLENPASWIPRVSGQRSAFQIPSKPSRAILRDTQLRTNAFLKIMLLHPTFATHEMLWEFFLVPDLQTNMMEQRSRLKAETRVERVRDEFEPLEETQAVEQFAEHARETVHGVSHATKSVARRINAVVVATDDLYDAARLVSRMVAGLAFMPATHISAMEAYINTLMPPASNPPQLFHSSILAMQSTIQAMLSALARPPQLIIQINSARKALERNNYQMSRNSRWPLGLLDEARQRLNDEKEEKARRTQGELDMLLKELRYTQQTVASELAGWQEMHARMGRQVIRDYAKGMLIRERERLHGINRALRKLRDVSTCEPSIAPSQPETPPAAAQPSAPSSALDEQQQDVPVSDGDEQARTRDEAVEENGVL